LEEFYGGSTLMVQPNLDLADAYDVPPDLEGEDGTEFATLLREEIIPEFNMLMGNKEAGKIYIKDRWPSPFKAKFYQIAGIYEIWNLRFANSKRLLQIIVLGNIPEHRNQSWASFAVSNFDIDIVKNKVSIASMTGKRKSMTRLAIQNLSPNVGFENELSLQSFDQGAFVYTVLPGVAFQTMFRRIRKYLQRGFQLKELRFDPRLTPFWKEYYMGRFNAVFAKQWANDLLNTAIRSNPAMTPEEQTEKEQTLKQFQGLGAVAGLLAQYKWAAPTREEFNYQKYFQVALERSRRSYR
jgi:hypothetical protein